MNNKSCIFVIKSKYELLTKTEKKIASFILENAESVISMSASELADASGTAGSAVVRCCKSLGFKGYTELKLALAAQLSRGKQLGFMPNIYPDDKPGDILDKIFSANVKTLHDTAEHINRKMLCSVIDMIGRSNSVYIYGIGTSAVFVQDFQYRLMQCGYTAFGMCDVPGMKISTMNIKPGDSAIGISHSGRTVATVEALRLAKEKGAETACITSCHGSPMMHALSCKKPFLAS